MTKQTVKTQVRLAGNNGKEYGYKKQYIMIDVVDGDVVFHGMAEANDENDIPNARRRALSEFHKMMDD